MIPLGTLFSQRTDPAPRTLFRDNATCELPGGWTRQIRLNRYEKWRMGCMVSEFCDSFHCSLKHLQAVEEKPSKFSNADPARSRHTANVAVHDHTDREERSEMGRRSHGDLLNAPTFVSRDV